MSKHDELMRNLMKENMEIDGQIYTLNYQKIAITNHLISSLKGEFEIEEVQQPSLIKSLRLHLLHLTTLVEIAENLDIKINNLRG